MKAPFPRLLIPIVSLLLACNLTFQPPDAIPSKLPQPSVPPATYPSSSPIPRNTSTQAPIVHDIAVRSVAGRAEFYNRATGDKFTPRGMNYIRLAHQVKVDGSSTFGHSLFDPGQYDPSKVTTDLHRMHADGYNVVRVFLSPDTMGTSDGGLSASYMHNASDFLRRAKDSQIYAMFTLDWIPAGKYGAILNTDCCSTFALMNANFLPPAGLRANQVFYQDFIRSLIALDAPIESVFSFELRNEMFYDTDQPPLSLLSGEVETANGRTYDMSFQTQKDDMVRENLVYWIDMMRASILEVDPTALVSVGFFHPQEPHPSRLGDPRLAVTGPAIWQSTADFIDLHAYPGFELDLREHVENFGVNGMQHKPLVLGEFGAEISRFPSVHAAAEALRAWQIESCKYGFDGWIFWTWDLTEQPDFFNAQMNDGAINGVLAPVARPDPCSS